MTHFNTAHSQSNNSGVLMPQPAEDRAVTMPRFAPDRQTFDRPNHDYSFGLSSPRFRIVVPAGC